MMKTFLSGNEAIGLAAIDAGVGVATAYPGTPSSDIYETIEKMKKKDNLDFFSEWAVNEKIALEICIGASLGGKRSICSMKHVGLNAAADPFMNVSYTGANAGLVIVVADDPGIFSSQNEQDSRYYADFSKMLCLEPSDQQEAYDMTYRAFEISEKYKIPVLVRSVTRISHTSMPVLRKDKIEKSFKIEKNKEKWVLLPAISRIRHKRLVEKYKEFKDFSESSEYNKLELRDTKLGIIASGNGYNYAMEFFPDASILKIGTYPLPEEKIKKLIDHVDKILVIEEGAPFIEEKLKCHKEITGRLTGRIPMTGELRPEFFSDFEKNETKKLPSRPPQMCVGCAYHRFYQEFSKVEKDVVVGDIGCYTLGAIPPYNSMDVVLCMGASVSMASGLSQTGYKKVVALIGDSTFFHSGLTALIDAVRNDANFTLVILDNSIVAMTGCQTTPQTPSDGKKNVSLEDIIKSTGANLTVFNIYDKEFDIKKNIENSFEKKGVKVFIAKFPCLVSNLSKK
ncbi:thiamine pyrophosphate-dependent enzyme [Candidatus Aenigmatarchaeota archaeon]